MYCKKCGAEIQNKYKYCLECGSDIRILDGNIDFGNLGYYFFGFFFTLLAFILGLVWKKSKPISSKQILIGCLFFLFAIIDLSTFMYSKSAALIFLGLELLLAIRLIKDVLRRRKEYIDTVVKTLNMDIEVINKYIKSTYKYAIVLVIGIIFAGITGFLILFSLLMPFIVLLFGAFLALITLGTILAAEGASTLLGSAMSESMFVFAKPIIICAIISGICFFIYSSLQHELKVSLREYIDSKIAELPNPVRNDQIENNNEVNN